MNFVVQKETLTRQYTLVVSELVIQLERSQYRILLFNNTSLANSIGYYFSQPRSDQEVRLVLDALLYALEELPNADAQQIYELMQKIHPDSYASLTLDEFIEEFAYTGEIIKKDLDYSCFGRVLPRF